MRPSPLRRCCGQIFKRVEHRVCRHGSRQRRFRGAVVDPAEKRTLRRPGGVRLHHPEARGPMPPWRPQISVWIASGGHVRAKQVTRRGGFGQRGCNPADQPQGFWLSRSARPRAGKAGVSQGRLVPSRTNEQPGGWPIFGRGVADGRVDLGLGGVRFACGVGQPSAAADALATACAIRDWEGAEGRRRRGRPCVWGGPAMTAGERSAMSHGCFLYPRLGEEARQPPMNGPSTAAPSWLPHQRMLRAVHPVAGGTW